MARRKTASEFISEASKIHNELYDYSNVHYVNTNTKVTIICRIHGKFEQSPKAHLWGQGCSACSNRSIPTTDQFIERAKNIHGDLYDYSQVKYVNNNTKIKIVCPLHGVFMQTPRNHIASKSKCPQCNGHPKLSPEQFIERAKNIHGDLYDYSQVEYVNMKVPVLVVCSEHGSWKCTPTSHIHSKTGCPICRKSKGERLIEYFLISNKVQYIDQYTPVGLRGVDSKKSHLRYDFFLPQQNLLIEFDGEQHYKFVHRYHRTRAGFIAQQKRDEIKSTFAISNNIKLIRIRYKDMNCIESILTEVLYG